MPLHRFRGCKKIVKKFRGSLLNVSLGCFFIRTKFKQRKIGKNPVFKVQKPSRPFLSVKSKNYFVITTNVDHCFQKSGFDKNRLFYTQGDYGLLQCSEPCCQETFDNDEIIKAMYQEQKDMKIPTGLIPKCPHCNKPLIPNLRCDDGFVQDEGWHKSSERYSSFINSTKNKNVLFLELGVGYNTPVIIKYPFWRYTAENKNATYACINFGDASAPKEFANRSICIDEDIHKVINDLQ